MKVNQLIANNINKLDTDIPFNKSFGIAGLSGSGKTTFVKRLVKNQKRLILLPKAEYQYLFPNIMETNFSAIKMEDMPLSTFSRKIIDFFQSTFNDRYTYWCFH